MRPFQPLAILLCLALAACAPKADLVITNVAVLDQASGSFIPGQSVVVDEGVIVSVREADGQAAGDRAREVLDGTGKYLIPGLIDAHTHIDHPDELSVYPSFGVTGTFVLRGFPNHLSWRAEIESGDRFGPRMFVTGDYMDGHPSFMLPMMSFRGEENLRTAVRSQKEAGYDFIKVYTRLSNEQREIIIEEAHQQGMCVLGHGGPNSTLEQLVGAGQDNIAHGNDINRWYFESANDPVGPTTEIIAGSSTTVTPNLSWTGGLIAQGTNLDSLLALPAARAVHPAILQPFRPANNRYIRDSDEWVVQVRERLKTENAVVLALQQAGVLLLAGTDASTSGVLPGDALHNELAMLVDAGLSPAEALATATSNAGEFLMRCLGSETLVGRIEEGYAADLVLLGSDPLEDITNSRDIAAVITAGHLDRADEIEARLDAMDADYAPLRPAIIQLEQALFGGETGRARVIFDSLRAERPGDILFSQYTPFFVGFGYLYGAEGLSTDPERLKAARDLYGMYTETYPDYHSGWYQLGLVHLAQGNPDSARAAFERSLAIHPFFPEALDQMANLTNRAD